MSSGLPKWPVVFNWSSSRRTGFSAPKGHIFGVVLVASIFGLTTLATMTITVTFGYLALGRLPFAGIARYDHALAGFVVLLCGAAVKVGL